MAVDDYKEAMGFGKSEVERLKKLLNQVDNQTTNLTPLSGSCSMVQSGNSFALITSKSVNSSIWIVDSGASDHMTSTFNHFSTYIPCLRKQKIRVAHGSLSPIAGKGNVQISPTLCLKSVLYVPNLSYNLLSVGKLTDDLKCSVLFTSSSCNFQDPATGKMIGHAELKDGLYFSEADLVKKSQESQGLVSTTFQQKDDQVWLWHRRLGHPSFPLLEKMFPSLFTNNKVGKFHCEICELAKHHRVSFPLKTPQMLSPFSLMHSDVWGPSRIPNIFGSRWFVSFIDDYTRTTWGLSYEVQIGNFHSFSSVPQIH